MKRLDKTFYFNFETSLRFADGVSLDSTKHVRLQAILQIVNVTLLSNVCHVFFKYYQSASGPIKNAARVNVP